MLRFAALAAVLLALPASAQTDGTTVLRSSNATVIADVPTYSAGMGRMDGPFTLISLDDGIVVAPDATTRADSASGAWDIGIRGTEVILNGGASGPGDRRGALLAGDADDGEYTLFSDGDGECQRGAARVVCHGSGNGWYEYASNGVQPLDRTLVVERPDGAAFRVRFVSYRLGDALPSGVRPRYVTLEVAPLRAEDALDGRL